MCVLFHMIPALHLSLIICFHCLLIYTYKNEGGKTEPVPVQLVVLVSKGETRHKKWGDRTTSTRLLEQYTCFFLSFNLTVFILFVIIIENTILGLFQLLKKKNGRKVTFSFLYKLLSQETTIDHFFFFCNLK